MEKAELIKNYKEVLKEIEVKEKDCTELKDKLTRSQEDSIQAQEKVTNTEGYQQSSNLTTVNEIEAARVVAQHAKADSENHNQLVENIELAVQNSDSALKALRDVLIQQKHLISVKLLDEKAAEIEVAAGHLFEEYTAIARGINNRPPPFNYYDAPDNLKFIAARDADLKGIQAGIFAKL